MKKKNESKDMIISLRRVKDVLVQYWWIVPVTILLTVVLVIAKGKTPVGEEAEAQSLVLMSMQTEELLDERYLDNFLIDGRSEYVTSQYLASDVIGIYSGESVQKKIKRQLEEAGFESEDDSDIDLSSAKVELVENTRVISVSAIGGDVEKSAFLVNLIADNLVQIANEQLEISGAKVIERANPEKADEKVKMTYVTKINIAIIALGIVFGLFILGIIVVLDNKIRSREEVDWCYESNYLGKISGKKVKELCCRIYVEIETLLDKKSLNSVTVISFHKDENFENLMSQMNENKKISFVSELLMDAQKVKQLRDAKGVIIALEINRDKFSELDELLGILSNMNVPVIGYLLKKIK